MLNLIRSDGEFLERSANRVEDLRELLNVSQLKIELFQQTLAVGELGAVTIRYQEADGQKCERCWHWETDIGPEPEHPTICGRCIKRQ